MKEIYHILLGLAIMTTATYAQKKPIKKADIDYSDYSYAEAINSYEKLIAEGYTEENIFKNLGNANYLNANYEEAAKWYGKLLDLEEAEVDPEYMYRYAQTLKSMKDYEESNRWMQKFKMAKSNDLRAIKFGGNLDYLDKIEKHSGRYTMKHLSVNSSEPDFAPSFYDKSLVFSSARDTGLISKSIHEWNNKGFLNLYYSIPNENGEYVEASKFSKQLNKKTHESSTVFTKDGSTVYFTRNNSDDGNFIRDSKGISRLKIYRATLNDSKWTDIFELPFNGDEYSVAHPSLNLDENKLYFASDMPGTLGKSDIFVVDIHKDGTFGTPENLGESINTEERETFPFITNSGILYFSSDGLPGLGGLDIYAANLKYLGITEVVNIGRPLNSEEDDFSFIIDEDSKRGFFASNRDGGNGDDDIYSFTENIALDLKCQKAISGIIIDKETNELLANAEVLLYDMDEIIDKTITSAEGVFELKGDCASENYKLIASKADYGEAVKLLYTIDPADANRLEIRLERTRKSQPNCLELPAMYYIIAGSFIDSANATKKIIELKAKGFNADYVDTDEFGFYRISYNSFKEVDKALSFLKTIKREEAPDAWLLEVETDLATCLDIEPIFFDLDKSYIKEDAKIALQKVIYYLKEYPNVKVRVGSHTDSRANDAYNKRLSERRAKATVEYIIQNGIEANRLTSKGFGETRLKNECSNGVPCSDKKHQANRRSDFIIVSH